MKGEGVQMDAHVAVTWFRKAAEQGYANAEYCLNDRAGFSCTKYTMATERLTAIAVQRCLDATPQQRVSA